MGILGWLGSKRRARSLDDVLEATIEKVLERGPFPKCGGCGADPLPSIRMAIVHDKKGNRGLLCAACASQYASSLRPDSVRNFWMCGACGYRVLAGSAIDATVDTSGNACPCCGADVNVSLVNLSNDRPIGRGLIGEPVE